MAEHNNGESLDDLSGPDGTFSLMNERNPEYEVLDPGSLYRGKSYSDWASEWFNWFLSVNPEKRNSGPVVFLKSYPPPKILADSYSSNLQIQPNLTGVDTLPQAYNSDLNYPNKYVNEPNIRIGSDRLQIYADQAVYVPIIKAYEIKIEPYKDYGSLQDSTGSIIDNGDDPPDPSQLTINTISIDLSKNKNQLDLKMEDFRITTPIFTLVVPDAQYGTSLKDFLEEGPIPPGNYAAMIDGYSILLKFPSAEKGAKTYWVHSWASAGREVKGPYFSELLYEIEVFPSRVKQARIMAKHPAINEGVISRLLNKKKQDGEYTDDQVNNVKSTLNRGKRGNNSA